MVLTEIAQGTSSKIELVNLFLKGLPADFLSFLGFDFIMKAYLVEFFKSPSNMILVCKIEGKLVGFVMACDSTHLIKNTILRHPFVFIISAFKIMLLSPMRSFNYFVSIVTFLFKNNSEIVREGSLVELCYIGVDPYYKNQKIGSAMVSDLIRRYEKLNKSIFVKTLLGEGELAATGFYLKNGFVSWFKCSGRHFLLKK
jgi:ribosomal protein S18 acetylase RimI-like enzyme